MGDSWRSQVAKGNICDGLAHCSTFRCSGWLRVIGVGVGRGMLEVFDAARHAQPSVGTYGFIVLTKASDMRLRSMELRIESDSKRVRYREESNAWRLRKAVIFKMFVFPLLAWGFAEGKGGHAWNRKDACRDRGKDGRTTCDLYSCLYR